MVLNKTLIKKSEEFAVQSGSFSFRGLMFNAGKKAAEIIMQKYDCRNKKITVVCGKGNNGGDGCVIASVLADYGVAVTVVTPFGKPTTENAEFYYNQLKFVNLNDTLPQKSDIIIDSLFGIGLDREIDSNTQLLISEINNTDCIKISIDIPSGVEADSGKVLGCAVKSDLTVTFIALKPCFLLPYGSDYCGETVVADIGIKPIDYSFLTIEKPYFPPRRHNSHKGDFGTAVMFCGSYGMAGAAILSAKAALRSGLGILKAVLCEEIYAPFTSSVPEAVCIPCTSSNHGTLTPYFINLPLALKGCSAILIGCGLGNNEHTKELLTEILKTAEVPIIIDADGINVLQNSIDIIKNTKASVILTPHPGEMARLLNISIKEVEENRIEIAQSFAVNYGCTLVLKGADTIVAEPCGKLRFNTTGNSGMSTGGSGDVLAGIIVSLLAQGMTPQDAAAAAVYLHGEAADRVALKRGERSLLPSDIIEAL